ncbi:MAG: hypothetical protein HY376_03010 [Candidatus Blackburnbacteria bacterium]|nr:hypothetical protein [Candidatus Blackburnbacteria bacterium]
MTIAKKFSIASRVLVVVALLVVLSFSATAQDYVIDPNFINPSDFIQTTDGNPPSITPPSFSVFQLFWFGGNLGCDSAAKTEKEAQLSKQAGRRVVCNLQRDKIGGCDYWCDYDTTPGISCNGDDSKCSPNQKCSNNQCVVVTCASDEHVVNHGCSKNLPTQYCEKPDGGSYYARGNVYQNGNFVAADQCDKTGKSVLQEYFCVKTTTGSFWNSKYVSCQYGCKDGVCLSQPSSTPPPPVVTPPPPVVTPPPEETTTDCGTSEPDYKCCTYKTPDPSACKPGDFLCRTPHVNAYLWRTNKQGCDSLQEAVGNVVDAGTNKEADDSVCIEKIGCFSAAKTPEQQKQESLSKAGIVFIEPESVPEWDGVVRDIKERDILKSLCMDDDFCKSNKCDDSKETRKVIDTVLDENKEFDSNLGRIKNRGGAEVKLTQPVQLVGSTEVFKADEVISGLCVPEPKPSDFGSFFKDEKNKPYIWGGAVILGLLIILPLLRPR